MVHYKLVKVTINVPGLAKMIIDIVLHHYKVSEFNFMKLYDQSRDGSNLIGTILYHNLFRILKLT